MTQAEGAVVSCGATCPNADAGAIALHVLGFMCFGSAAHAVWSKQIASILLSAGAGHALVMPSHYHTNPSLHRVRDV